MNEQRFSTESGAVNEKFKTDPGAPTVNPAGRFDYVKYDEISISRQAHAKEMVEAVEHAISSGVQSPRYGALAKTALEECYFWIGKGIRDDQLARNKNSELQEERNNS